MVAQAESVLQVDPLADPSWDAKIWACPGASFFHSGAWARVLHQTYGFRPVYLVRQSGERFLGVLPLMEVDSWVTGRRGVSLPFSDSCAPLTESPETTNELVSAANAYAQARRWRSWEMRGGRCSFAAPAAMTFHGHDMDLRADTASLLSECTKATRGAIHQAERSDITVSFARTLEATREFHRLLCKTRARHGVPPQPWRFFENIHRHILNRGKGWVVLASLHGRAIAGAVFFHFGRSVIYKFAASDGTSLPCRPNNLVLWRAIEWYAGAGFSHLDFGRTALNNEGLRRFKLSWGATERRIEYVRFNCRTAAFEITRDRSSGWPSRVFRFVPPTLARLIGSAAYKHVA
jgi:CelD/BcsL family acetyltransferase involved in cellulose biosynthesis